MSGEGNIAEIKRIVKDMKENLLPQIKLEVEKDNEFQSRIFITSNRYPKSNFGRNGQVHLHQGSNRRNQEGIR